MKQILELIYKRNLKNTQMLIIDDDRLILEYFIGQYLYKILLIEFKNKNYEVLILPNNIPRVVDFEGLENIILSIEKETYKERLTQEEINQIKEKYVAGTKIELIKMYDYINAVPTGIKGKVDHVDDLGTIHVNWENGSTLGLIVGKDEFKVIE